ncbi:MAG: glycosyltransferase [Flavobacteriales bacterium]|nr:glycosyltransferase [Flavobacteriales bacterium]
MAKIVLSNNKKYDLIYCHDLSTSYPAYIISKKLNIPIIYDVHDLGIETINQLFPNQGSPLEKLFYKLAMHNMKFWGSKWEAKFTKKTSLIHTVNRKYKEYLEQKYNVSNCEISPNYTSLNGHRPALDLFDRLQIARSKKLVVYHGGMNPGRNLETIVQSANFLDDNVEMVLIGDGFLKKALLRIMTFNEKQNNIHFMPLLSYPELIHTIKGSSLGLVLNQPINISKKFAQANKLIEYMAAGVPVLASLSNEHSELITKTNSGFVENINSPQQLGELINNIISMDNLANIGENGILAFQEKLNWEQHETAFDESIKAVLANNN